MLAVGEQGIHIGVEGAGSSECIPFNTRNLYQSKERVAGKSLKISAAFRGPMVWLLEGPKPIL